MRDQEAGHVQVIEHIYEGTLTDSAWNKALASIASVTDSTSSSIVLHNKRTDAVQILEHESYGLSADALAAFKDHYNLIDPARKVAPFIPVNHWYHDVRDLGRPFIQRSEWYQDYARHHGVATNVLNHLLDADGIGAYLSIRRGAGQPDYTTADLNTAGRAIVPHVQRALRIRTELLRQTRHETLTAFVWNQLHIPVLVLDEEARIVESNAQAQALMRRAPQLAIRHGRLSPQGMKPGQFDHLLKTACGRHGPAMAGGVTVEQAISGTARKADGAQYSALQYLVLPLPAPEASLNPWARPLALVVLHESGPGRRADSPPNLPRQLFGLTPAESKVALALCQGDTLAQTAQRLGISVHTARGYLKAIFAKTGATRQADLMRLLTTLSALGGTSG
jgi:DNA-binding CsgD family transcriptional regulator/PAS domain-containing protein